MCCRDDGLQHVFEDVCFGKCLIVLLLGLVMVILSALCVSFLDSNIEC